MILDAWQRKVSRRGEYSKQRKPAKKQKHGDLRESVRHRVLRQYCDDEEDGKRSRDT